MIAAFQVMLLLEIYKTLQHLCLFMMDKQGCFGIVRDHVVSSAGLE
ncbi:Uncharacterised protein [Mycobacteroides abscessus subsp. abscessus]|nr:Uncharacterised protein [Mycobacteroides abscessus subsp. abscessus]